MDDGPEIPVRMNKRTTVTTLRHMNGDHLLGLRDVIKSENGPYVRCHNQAAEDNKRNRVNVWYKEQRLQLEKIKRGQRKFYLKLVKVHRDKRKCQREEYKRKQEEIRKDLQNIRLRRLILRVVDRFRENVKRKKAERARKRFAIAGGMRSFTGNSVAKHGVFGVGSQAADSVTRMVKLAAKKQTLQREGVLPEEKSQRKPRSLGGRSPVGEHGRPVVRDIRRKSQEPDLNNATISQPLTAPETRDKVLASSGSISQPTSKPHQHLPTPSRRNETAPVQIQQSNSQSTDNPIIGTHGKLPQSYTRVLGASTKTEASSSHQAPVFRKQPNSTENQQYKTKLQSKEAFTHRSEGETIANEPNVSRKGLSRLTVENVAVHEVIHEMEGESAPEQNIKQTFSDSYHDRSSRISKKSKVMEVSKDGSAKSRLLVADESVGLSPKSSRHQLTEEPKDRDGFAAIEENVEERPELGELRNVPRRATIKPPSTKFLTELLKTDAETLEKDEENQSEAEEDTKPKIRLSRMIRKERKEKERERLRLLNEELIPHYKRSQSGNLTVQMVPFVRSSFQPPSNKIRYSQDKMKKEEKLNMARQRVRLRNFVQNCPVADPISTGLFWAGRKTPDQEENFDMTAPSQASLATLMFNVYHQEKPPEGVDPNSVEALKKCRYIRYYDIAKTRRAKADVFRKQFSSWDNATRAQQEQRRQLLLLRQQRPSFNR